jgi:hypothetical protein
MAELDHRAAENLLRFLLEQQAAAMARKGIEPDLIAKELRSLENSIRRELWGRVLTPEDVG